MIDLIFPDGSQRQYEDGATGGDVAASIAKSLEKRAVLIKLDGKLYDLDRALPSGGVFEILTRDAPEALDTIRHDASHVMAEAVQELFPGTQVTIGPAIEDGFYYDFARDTPFSLDDLATIETRMKEIVDRDEPITREVWNRDDAPRPATELKAELQPRLYDLAVNRFHGSYSAEHGVGPHNQAFYDLYTPELVKEVCRLLKQRLDPSGLLGTVRLG